MILNLILNLKFVLLKLLKLQKSKIELRKIIGIINSGVTAKNLNKPGAWAKPTAVKTFLNGTLVCLSGKSLTPIT